MQSHKSPCAVSEQCLEISMPAAMHARQAQSAGGPTLPQSASLSASLRFIRPPRHQNRLKFVQQRPATPLTFPCLAFPCLSRYLQLRNVLIIAEPCSSASPRPQPPPVDPLRSTVCPYSPYNIIYIYIYIYIYICIIYYMYIIRPYSPCNIRPYIIRSNIPAAPHRFHPCTSYATSNWL